MKIVLTVVSFIAMILGIVLATIYAIKDNWEAFQGNVCYAMMSLVVIIINNRKE